MRRKFLERIRLWWIRSIKPMERVSPVILIACPWRSRRRDEGCKKAHRALTLILFLTAGAFCTEVPDNVADSADQEAPISAAKDTNFIFEYIAHPILKTVMWPVEKVLVPGIEFAFYPAREPFNYIVDNNVIDQVLKMASFGPKNNMMFYPVLSLTTGTGSMTGFSYRNFDLFARGKERLVIQYSFYVNGDQKIRSDISAKNVFGSQVTAKLSTRFLRFKINIIPQPHFEGVDSMQVNYADSSNKYALTLSHPFFEKVSVNAYAHFLQNRLRSSPYSSSLVQPDNYFFNFPDSLLARKRGLDQDYDEISLAAGISRNSIDNPNIPTSGSMADFMWYYHLTKSNHDYHNFYFKYQKYFFLGIERYTITPEEQKKMGNINFNKIKKLLDYKTLKQELFKRKVVVTQLYMGSTFEVPGHTAPINSLQTISNSLPMRGYSGSPYRDWSLMALSMEYRFPVIRLVEGTIFNEYASVGENYQKIVENKKIVNSWGFGFRIARHNIFIMRTQIGFHGLSGMNFNITVNSAY